MVVTRGGNREFAGNLNKKENPASDDSSKSKTPTSSRCTRSKSNTASFQLNTSDSQSDSGTFEKETLSSEVQAPSFQRATRNRSSKNVTEVEAADSEVSEAESCASAHSSSRKRSVNSKAKSQPELISESHNKEGEVSETESCSSSVSGVQAPSTRKTRNREGRIKLQPEPISESRNKEAEVSEAESCSSALSGVQIASTRKTRSMSKAVSLPEPISESHNEETEAVSVSEAESCSSSVSGNQAPRILRSTRSRQSRSKTRVELQNVIDLSSSVVQTPSTKSSSRQNIKKSQPEPTTKFCEESIDRHAGKQMQNVTESRRSITQPEFVTNSQCGKVVRSELKLVSSAASSPQGEGTKDLVQSEPDTVQINPKKIAACKTQTPSVQKVNKSRSNEADSKKDPQLEQSSKFEPSKQEAVMLSDSASQSQIHCIQISEGGGQSKNVPDSEAISVLQVEDLLVNEMDSSSAADELVGTQGKKAKLRGIGQQREKEEDILVVELNDEDECVDDPGWNKKQTSCSAEANLDLTRVISKEQDIISLDSSDDESDTNKVSDGEDDYDDVVYLDSTSSKVSKPPTTENQLDGSGLFVIDTTPGLDSKRKFYLDKEAVESRKDEESEEDDESKDEEESEEDFIDEDDDENLLKSKKSSLIDFSSSIDPGLNLKKLGGLYISFDAGKPKPTTSAVRKLKEQKRKDELLEKSIITPDFETMESVPAYKESIRQLKKQRREERAKTTGDSWFNMKAPEMTDELKNDLKALKMRAAMDPKRFYKKNDRDGFPKYFQVGTVVDSPIDFHHARIPKKQRKRTIVEELIADAEFRRYNKKKYHQIMSEKAALAAGKKNRKFKKFRK
ncbi:deoxynucleotidyltransferase terminal-interacting protein 2 [Latimeria chalumnae]|uniref:deoxynucleotidyltransferase terminal-interacting protein 2 n=1 Tax=Latimeria chalumnae TaxID=7897 RepID=UPI0003C19623|nr:PREDICTED: deoxynucleotidyltransferase terminal-interacting protein 2 [Latimeria chalumnae]|eukprot:XP_006012347.1 PREDICTED: deoxynucleotidyltransferase terminal-interacting protein 2 [Latimeria chalumnae]